MKSTLRLFLIVTMSVYGLSLFAQDDYPLMTIREATEVPVSQLIELETRIAQGMNPDDSAQVALHHPPTIGDTIRVHGVITNDPFAEGGPDRRKFMLGSALIVFIQDPNDPEWGGLHLRETDTTNFPTDLNQFEKGDYIRVTGIMEEFFSQSSPSMTQMRLLSTRQVEWLGHVDDIDTLDHPEYSVLPTGEFVEGSEPERVIKFSTGERWKGARVRFENVRVASRSQNPNTLRWTWSVIDEAGNEVNIYDPSKFFRGGDAGVDPEWAPPPINALINIQGLIMTQSRDLGGYTLAPVTPGDIEVIAVPPVFDIVERDAGVPGSNEDVTITTSVFPPSEETPVLGVDLYYIIDGDTTTVAMTDLGDDAYSATIPGQPDGTEVHYYLVATWDGDPISTPFNINNENYFYLVKDGELTIQELRYSPFFPFQYPTLVGFEVTVSGVVTADLSDNADYAHIQNGTGGWSGIWVRGPGIDDSIARGDSITVTGEVEVNFGVPRIGAILPDAVEVHATDVPLPEAELLTTEMFRLGRSNYHSEAEPWKGVLVEFEDLELTDDDPDNNDHLFREFVVDDGSGGMRVDEGPGSSSWLSTYSVNPADNPVQRIQNGTTIDKLTGIMYFSFGNYKLVPRSPDDFMNLVSVTDLVDGTVPERFELSQNYPNPFNPATQIRFSLPNDAHVTMRIFNVLGQQVKVLVDEYHTAGTYTTTFDAGMLSSGVYFYRIEAGDFVETKRLMLIK